MCRIKFDPEMEDENKSLLKSEGDSGVDRDGAVLRTIKGIVLLSLGTFFASTSRICVQALERSVPDFELNSMRCGFAMVGMILYHLVTRTFPVVKVTNIFPVGMVNVLTNVSTLAFYVSVTFIPLATSESLLMTSGMISGMVLFKICNKEKIKWDKMIAVPLCIVGVFLILQPPIIFSQNSNHEITKDTSLETYSNKNALLDNISTNTVSVDNISSNQTAGRNISSNETFGVLAILGNILAVFAGLLTSVQISVVKHYNDFFTTHNLLISLSWSYVTGTVLSLIPMLIWEDPVIPNTEKDILLVIAHAGTYVFIMPLHLYGSLLVSGNLGSLIRTQTLVLVLIAQYTFLNNIHPGHRNWIEVVGVIYVLFGTIFSSLVETLKDCRSSKEENKI